eukprot:gnl/MRDRNA2_/MRDRNA2_145214_c0_seq1.p1 gnl/MRDRNA2_/MRDRNA2_145214_c0~~gnl/MRDRNA2_/MRDRNA2_145214_c0_seq1.p1  ORF type:complete len:348 (+),score=79.65 gnl/MRDRNA2_/MRDRNA2_145214_c0_seq1:113-1156(+)
MPRAVIAERIGNYKEVLRLVDSLPVMEPLPKDTMRIQVAAAGMGFPDLLQVEGKYQIKAKPPFVPVNNVAGKIIAVGPGVDQTAWPIGAQIVGNAAPGPAGQMCGGLAEEALVETSNAILLPEGMSADVALAMHENYWDAHHAVITCGKVAEGDTLLVLGASGACGLAAVDLGKAWGAKVIACASTAAKLDVCKKGGADVVIDYETGGSEGFLKRLKEAGVYGKVTVVYDPVGGRYGEAAFRSMARGGRYVVFGFASGGTDPKSAFPQFPINLLLMKGQQIIGSMGSSRDQASDMFKMVKDGRLKPVVGSKYSLNSFMQAFDDVANRKVTGKVIISTKTISSAQSKL